MSWAIDDEEDEKEGQGNRALENREKEEEEL